MILHSGGPAVKPRSTEVVDGIAYWRQGWKGEAKAVRQIRPARYDGWNSGPQDAPSRANLLFSAFTRDPEPATQHFLA